MQSHCKTLDTTLTLVLQIEDDDVLRWAGTLPRARVTRWGGMISTPDAVLQAMIKRSLQESGCPAHIVNELMENAHERRLALLAGVTVHS